MNKEQQFEAIKKQIESIYQKGTEPAPEYYAKILVDIMKYGGLDEKEIKRFFKYIPNDVNNILLRSVLGGTEEYV